MSIIASEVIKSTIDCSSINRISFWNALNAVAAEYSHCGNIWTEDLNAGRMIHGVWVENPLKNNRHEEHEE